MFKDVSIWCVILGIVILMFVHHILSNESLIEGNENVDEEETAEGEPEVTGDSTVEEETTTETVEETPQEDEYMDLSKPSRVNLKIKTDTAAELQSILLQQPIISESTTETTEVDEPLPVEEETESIQESFM